MRARWQGSCLWAAALFVLAGSCHAQSATPDQEYQKLIQVDQNIEPLGEHPFGESINLYDGSFEFDVTDVNLRGNGPAISVGRTMKFWEWIDTGVTGPQRPFANWDLDIPRIETLVSDDLWQTGGFPLATQGTTQRCTNFKPPPGVSPPGTGTTGYSADDFWYGYHLLVPGQGDQVLMPRVSTNSLSPTISGLSFQIVTKNNWMIGCGVTASDGGEGFLAIAPDGTRYTFAHLFYRPANTIAAFGSPLQRHDAFMYVTQIQDRFGNTLTYNYDPSSGYLSSITASDGREVDVAYASGTPMIQSVTAKATNVASRTWTYSYNTSSATLPVLTGVQLPDGSAWSYQFDMEALQINFGLLYCGEKQVPSSGMGSPILAGTMTAPSGLTATFYAAIKVNGRSYVPQECFGNAPSNNLVPYYRFPPFYGTYSIASEVLSGSGMPTQTWSYSYSPFVVSFDDDACATSGTCATTVYTDVTDPNGNDTRYTYSNRFDATEGQLLRTDSYSGAAGGTLLRSVVNTYANPTGGPWPTAYGTDLLEDRDNYFQTEELSPQSQRTTTQDGQNYTWQAMAFNAYAQPTDVKRYNDIGGQSTIEETTAYLNDTNLWVLGLPQTVTNVGTGEVESSNTYNSSDLLQSRSHFGEFMMSYTYNSAGQLASFTDGNNHTTSISNYYRGIPQSIAYPDSTSQSLTVDDLSEISSITDQAGYTTHYSYNPIGRITGITYPTNDPNGVSWYAENFTYNYVTGAERGLTGAHWDRITTTGNAVTTTYFDADLRPVLSDRAINGTANSDVTTATAYDYTGAKTFASYPVSGSPAVTAVTIGTHNTYDALERVTQSQEDSEVGTLTTSTAYLAGAGEQVTDPKGNVTTTYYQVFDEPDYKAPISVAAPGGINQAIVRDIYGNPKSITQSGLYGTESDSVTKMLMYDSYYRLCRTTEPESGSTVMAYDAANNLAWSAQGQTITDGTCGQTAVASGAQTARTYDAMNRVKTITPPAGTQTTSYTYDARGNISNVVSGSATNTFGYNSRNLLTSQTLSVGSYAWGIGYNYDGYGHVSAVGYPAYNGSSEGVAYSPDALGRPTQVSSYASGITYFPNDQVAGFNYGNGASYVAQQNTRQLLSNFSYGAGSTLNLSEDFAYDNNGNITNVTDLVNGQRTKAFTYDALNRLSSATATNLYGTENYTYDALNNLRTRLTGGNALTLNYDATNRLVSVAQNGSVVTQYGYDTQGNRNSLSNGGATTNYNFDAENQLLQVPGVEGYAYDAAGRRVAKTTSTGTPTGYYFYDQAGQLMFQYVPSTASATNFIYLGSKLIARDARIDTQITGNIDGVSIDGSGNATIVGWACSTNLAQSIDVDLYIGGPYGNGGIGIGRYVANVTSEPAVATACDVTTGSYRFSIPLTSAQRTQYVGQLIYVYGISPVGGQNLSLANSGTYAVPANPSAPAAPASLSATVAANLGSITATWSSVSNATSYNVQYNVNGGAWSTPTSVTIPSYTLNAPADGSYTFEVQACDTAGCSTETASTAVGLWHPPTAAPSLSAPSLSANGTYSVTWTGVSGQVSYHLQQQVNGGTWTAIQDSALTSWSASGEGDGTYAYRVQACNAGGCGPFSNTGTATVDYPPSTAPGISVPSTSGTGSYTVTLGGATGATSLTLQESTNGGSTWTTVMQSLTYSWSTSGRGNGTYDYRVQACDAGGCGPWSGTAQIVVTLPPTTAPTLNVNHPNIDSDTLVLTWSAVAGATYYQVQQSTNGTTYSVIYSEGGYLTFSTAPGSGTFYYEAQACNVGGCGPWSPAFKIEDVVK